VRRAHLLLLILAAAALATGCGGSDGKRLSTTLPQPTEHLLVSSPAFSSGARLQKKYTCDGAGDEPVVRASGIPPRTREIVVIVSDPDAPKGTFVHVTRYGLSPRDGAVSSGGQEGRNSAGKIGWTPPCPPPGDLPHHYVWTVFALRDHTGLKPGAQPEDVVHAVSDGELAAGAITATYSRSG
jgi:Raf kinase inhibitor-like YbhB/YbcL family protein